MFLPYKIRKKKTDNAFGLLGIAYRKLILLILRGNEFRLLLFPFYVCVDMLDCIIERLRFFITSLLFRGLLQIFG